MESSYSIEYQVMYVASILFGSAKLYICDLFINKDIKSHCFYHRVHREWQWQLSAVHSIHHVQSCTVHSNWEGRYTPPISTLPLYVLLCSFYHRVHRVATAVFWRTFSDEGKISPGRWGWGVHAHPLSLHLPSPVKLQCTLFHLYQYMYSVVSTSQYESKQYLFSATKSWRKLTLFSQSVCKVLTMPPHCAATLV